MQKLNAFFSFQFQFLKTFSLFCLVSNVCLFSLRCISILSMFVMHFMRQNNDKKALCFSFLYLAKRKIETDAKTNCLWLVVCSSVFKKQNNDTEKKRIQANVFIAIVASFKGFRCTPSHKRIQRVCTQKGVKKKPFKPEYNHECASA